MLYQGLLQRGKERRQVGGSTMSKAPDDAVGNAITGAAWQFVARLT